MDIPVKRTDLEQTQELAERLKLEKIASKTNQAQADMLGKRVKELQDEVVRLNHALDNAYVLVDISDDEADWGPIEYIGYPINMQNSGYGVGFRQYRYHELIDQVSPDLDDHEPLEF